MGALTVTPWQAGSARVTEEPDPEPGPGEPRDHVPDRGVAHGPPHREIVLENDVVFGSVNADPGHYTAAAQALVAADAGWLGRLITRRVPLEDFADALRPAGDDVKVVPSLGD